jgi:hypothetical protein
MAEAKTYDGELNISGLVRVGHSVSELIDILDPLVVAVQFVSGEADNLDTTLLELLLLARDFAKFGGADLIKITKRVELVISRTCYWPKMGIYTHRSEISRVREENAPGVAEPFVELDRTFGGLSLEVGGNASKTKRHCFARGLAGWD